MEATETETEVVDKPVEGQEQVEESTETTTEKTEEEGKEKKEDETNESKKSETINNHDFRRMKKFIAEAAAQKQRADMLQAQIESLSEQRGGPASDRPTKEQYPDPADYAEALVTWQDKRHRMEIEAIRADRDNQPAKAQFATGVQAVKAKYSDYEETMEEAQSMPVTPALASAILASPAGAEIQYHLAKHPEEYESLMIMPEQSMWMRIGEMTAKMSSPASKPGAKPSGAPAPVKPVGGRGTGASKRPEDMTMAEWAKWDEEHGYTARRRKGQ
jgi:hypothetical protein